MESSETSSPLQKTLGSPPEAVEATSGNAGIAHCHRRIPMAEVVLHGAQIGALVGQGIAAAVAQHVRVHVAEPCLPASRRDQVVDRMPAERRPPLRDKQPRKVVLATREVSADGAQLVARNRMLDG